MPERAQLGIKRPAFTRGCGGGVSPRTGQDSLRRCAGFMPAGHSLGCNILCCRGRGVSSPTNQNTSMKAFLYRFLKIIFAGFYARKGILWDATFYVAGGVGRAAPQTKALTTHTLFSEGSCPKGCNLGLNALRLRGGAGATQAPAQGGILAKVRRFYARKGIFWDATSYVAEGVGRAAPH